MNPLTRLSAKIAELEAERAELESVCFTVEQTPPPPPVDWESRLSAARAVDLLTGADTAATVESQRQADTAAREKQARKAAQGAQEAAQRREAIESLARDLEAANGLLARELTAAANNRLSALENDFHRARTEWLESAQRYAGCLALCGQETAAHQLLRAVGVTGDTVTIVGRRVNQLRLELLNEEETERG